TDKVLNIATSSVVAAGGVLGLIKGVGEKVSISTLIQDANKTIDTGDKFIPMLISISDEQLMRLSVERHNDI
ncbi:22395_t:CDS:1, partial [Gigaspora margarita]